LKIPALIMAGGLGKRMELKVEKPLLQFMGKPLIERVVTAVKSSTQISKFYVVTSPNTPKTEAECLGERVPVIRTDGKGYHSDLVQAITEGNLLCPVMIIPSDLPALTGQFLDKVVSAFEESGKDALAVFIPIEIREKFKLSVSSTDEYRGTWYAVSGVNIIDGSRIRGEEKVSTSAIITSEIEVLLNINTQNDLAIAERIFRKLRRESSQPSPAEE
jgi:adenosylcobinamide-phosphate guanylyltransferase